MITLKNDKGVTKKVKSGISWTYFFFGSLVPLFRGDWKWTIISLLLAPVTFGISHIVFFIKYNDWYMNDLQDKGYTVI